MASADVRVRTVVSRADVSQNRRMQHARASARRRPQRERERDPLVRHIEVACLAVGLVCTWIYVGMLVVDGERMAGLLTWPFVGIVLAVVAFRIVAIRRLRRRARGGRTRS